MDKGVDLYLMDIILISNVSGVLNQLVEAASMHRVNRIMETLQIRRK